LTLAILGLHALLARDRHSHPLLALIILNIALGGKLSRALDYTLTLDASQIATVHHLSHRLILRVTCDLFTDFSELYVGDHRGV